MPIYAYQCEDCGFTKDVLQKLSDKPLTICPSCGKNTFQKRITAAAVQNAPSSSASSPCGCCCANAPGNTPCCM